MSNDPVILVVDDEEVMREFVSEVLEEFNVSLARDGREGIDMVNKIHPDLVITDIRMPVVNGDEVVRHCKKLDEQIKVIVITGYTSLDMANECVKMGADGFLSKPFTIGQLREAVDKCLGSGAGG